MTARLVGFDSAWTAANAGALVGLFRCEDRTFQELGPPQVVDYRKAEQVILEWQRTLNPASTIVLLDQPTIVRNRSGQRPVEHIVGSSVSLRYGGMQPANTAKTEMFGKDAPVCAPTDGFRGSAGPPNLAKNARRDVRSTPEPVSILRRKSSRRARRGVGA
jgi:predicted RNase H-like nuclease